MRMMVDRETVIDILGACGTDDCDNCPLYNGEGCGCMDGFVTVPKAVLANAIALLREQEPVKPICGYGYFICGVCKNPINSTSQKFCSECGKAVKWDD